MIVQHTARLHEGTVQAVAKKNPVKKSRRNPVKKSSKVTVVRPRPDVLAAAKALVGTNGYTKTRTKSESEVWVL